MNKANFNDMFKSILIILLFIIIIGLIWITTNPKFIKDMICNKWNIEGFTSNINVFNPGFSGIEFPNIGNPTYLNIGRCNANSPYVFNSGCSDNDNNNNGQTTEGGFLYKFKCRPSLTGQFEVCGPLGYSARPDFS